MAAQKYIILKDSVNYKSKRFRVMFEGYSRILNKDQSIQKGINGNLDVSMGAVYEERQFTIRVRHTDPDSNYGNLSDLEYFYSLNDPNPTSGSASNIITFIDHYENQNNVIFGNKFEERTLTTVLEGNYAWFLVPIILLFLEPIA